ncbi:unnamed protein product, partial [Angiostrongylus costaricensis]|uniref:MSP domain-containing protein n=1 Tax=Angiostrongylus costaricensis TaxID=334426 RepID=A0A0R3PPU0_ANGCS
PQNSSEPQIAKPAKAPKTTENRLSKHANLELIEPRILVSINRNYLVYGRKLGRPPANHLVTIVNHGEHPVAFKVLTTDNYAYFVNQVFGVIPGRHLHAIPHIRAPNQFTLQVNRRPYNCFCDEQQPSHWNTPRKDKLFILLAPLFSFNIAPESLFHHENPYEKLRICLEYTGMPVDPKKGGSADPVVHLWQLKLSEYKKKVEELGNLD